MSNGEETEAKTVRMVSFGGRVVATLLDALLLAVGSFMLGMVLGLVGTFLNMYNYDEPIPVHWVVVVSGLLLSIFYYVGLWSKSGQTIAKAVLNQRVVGADGKPVSVGKATLRYLGYIVSGVLLSLGFLWAAFDRRRQGLHDKLGGTFVVKADDVIPRDGNVAFVSDDKPGWGGEFPSS